MINFCDISNTAFKKDSFQISLRRVFFTIHNSHCAFLFSFHSAHNLDFDYTQLPPIIQETMNPGMKVNHIKYTNISLNFGYAYNWVFARNCLACLSLNPAVAYKTSRIRKAEEETDEWYKNFNIDFILRVGIVYNNSKYFAGTSFVGRTYDYYRNNFSLNNGFGTLQVYAGFNFCLKKEHRKKKQ